MKELIPIVAYFVIFIGYIVWNIRKGTTSKSIISLVTLLISIMFAVAFNNVVAGLISNKITILQMKNDINILLTIEIIYYKLVAFSLVLVLTQVLLNIVVNATNLVNKMKLKNIKPLTGVVSAISGFIWVTILMSIFMSTAYATEYGSKTSSALASPPIIGGMMDTVAYDFVSMMDRAEENVDYGASALNIEMLKMIEADGYATKTDMLNILNNFDGYHESVQSWLKP